MLQPIVLDGLPRALLGGVLVVQLGCGATGRTSSIASPDREEADRDEVRDAITSGPDAVRLDTILDALSHPPFGSGAALTYSVGERVETRVRGVAFDDGPAITEDTAFNLASVSKLVTAAIVLSLVDEGRIALDAPLSRHLPGVRLITPSGEPTDVTVEQLLAHRAGLPHQPSELDPIAMGSSWTDPRLLRVLTSSWALPLVSLPGEYHYSNLGYALLGALIEADAPGESTFAEVAAPHLARLGMLGATYWPDTLEGPAAHGRIEDAGVVHFNAPAWYGARYSLPFTGLWASMPALHRFGVVLLGAHRDPDAALHAMTRPLAEHEVSIATVRRVRAGAPSIEHDGSGPGFLAWLIVVPNHDLVIAVACNGGGESRAVGERFHAITDDLVEALLPRD